MIVVLAFAILVTAWAWRRDRARSTRTVWLMTLSLRLAAVALLALAVSGTDIGSLFRPRPRPSIVLMVDESRSMSLRDGRADARQLRAGKVAARLGAIPGIGVRRQGVGSDFTDLGQAIADGAINAPDALVLLSDGNHNRGSSPVNAAVLAGIPVHAIGFGPADAGPRPVISDIRCPDRVEVGEQFGLRAEARGGDGPLAWTLREGGRVIDQATGRSVTLSAKTAVPGLHRYSVAAAQDGETCDQRSLTVLAGHSKISVVWLDLAPDWNRRFASQALAADPSVTVEPYSRVAGRWVRTRGSIPVPLDSMPPCDVLVLAGGNGATLPPDLERFIDRAVLGKGNGFLVIGHVKSGGILLPLRVTGQPAAAGEVVLEEAWRRSGWCAAQDTALATRVRKGPPMALPVRLAPVDSTVVVLASVRTVPAGSAPLWAWRYDGNGRVMQFASSDLWKWRLGLAGARRDTVFYDQAIINTVRWLAGRERLAFQIGPEQGVFSTNDRVSFRGRWQGWDERAGGAARWNVAVSGPGGFRRTVILSDWGNGDYAGQAGQLGPGAYTYRTAFTVGGTVLDRGQGEFFVEPGRDESQDLTQNRELLKEIAASSGGRYFEADAIPPDGAWLLAATKRVSGPRGGEQLLFLVLGVIGLLAAEWAVRRWHGLR